MKAVIVYPLPFDNWDTFEPDVRRFTQTFRDHPPGYAYELWAMCCWGEPTDEVRRWFYGIKTKFQPAYVGCDCISVHQAAASAIDTALMVNMTTRCYFHREGWLRRFIQAREKYGRGLYGASASLEIDPHICNRAYAIDAELLRDYPFAINSREDAPHFEAGHNSITRYVQSRKLAAMQVTWDGCQNQAAWRVPEGIFRRGEQNAMLVWDRHTDLYAKASPEEKVHLENLTDGLRLD